MKVKRRDTYTIFEFGTDQHRSWTLCVIDDHWEEAIFLVNKVYPLDVQAFEEYRAKIGRLLDNTSRMGVACLPLYCDRCAGLGRLVVGDFPMAENQNTCVHYAIEAYRTNPDVAFLIDLYDPRLGIYDEPEIQILNWLEEEGVPLSQCAFLTVGGPSSKIDLEVILKEDVLASHGRRLRDWWEAMRGRITDAFFMKITDKYDPWHEPTKLAQVLEDEQFLRFVRQQANRECYGVWEWVYWIVGHSSSSFHDKQYALLCGKAFLKASGFPESAFPFTALRGLIFGLCGQRDVMPAEQPKEVPTDMSGIDCLGWYSTSSASFEEFSIALRNWLQKLERDVKGTEKLDSAKILRQADKAFVVLHFTGSIPEAIFDTSGAGGLVTKGWIGLCECFDSGNQPEPKNDRREVWFTFPRWQSIG